MLSQDTHTGFIHSARYLRHNHYPRSRTPAPSTLSHYDFTVASDLEHNVVQRACSLPGHGSLGLPTANRNATAMQCTLNVGGLSLLFLKGGAQ